MESNEKRNSRILNDFLNTDPEKQIKFWKEFDNDTWQDVIELVVDDYFHTGDEIKPDNVASLMYDKGGDYTVYECWGD